MPKTTKTCTHPPHRLYSGHTYNPWRDSMELWVSCCECGKLLKDACPEAHLPGAFEPGFVAPVKASRGGAR